jgi:hypothetical protein
MTKSTVLRLSGSKREEETGEYRKLYNAELQHFYSSPDITREMKPKEIK